MANSNLPVPKRALEGSVTKPSQSSTPVTLTTTKRVRSVTRTYSRDPDLIELGGGLVPGLKCNRNNLGAAVCAVGALIGFYYAAKYGIKALFAKKENPKENENGDTDKAGAIKIQPLVECVSSSNGPKPVVIPGFLYQGGIGILGGRTGIGKSLLLGQLAVEMARGDGEFIPPSADGSKTPRSVIIIDGEMEDDDYVARFPDPSTIPGNITRISECDFVTAKQLTNCIRGIVSGLMSEAVIIIDNIAALVKNPTASDIFDMYRDLRLIQRETAIPVTFLVGNHLAKVPEGMSIDETFLAGSANITRFASSIAILDKSARGSDYRFLKIIKERKNGPSAEVIELEYSEVEYKHYNFFGTAPEDEVLYTKTNRKRFGQEVPDEDPEEDEDPKPDGRGEPWTEEDDRLLSELFNTHTDPTPAFFAELMGKNKNTVYKHGKELGFEWKKQKSGPKPKQKPTEDQEQE